MVYLMQLRTTLWLLNKIIEMGIIILFIVFQPELRSILERAGRTRMSMLPFAHTENSLRQATIWVSRLTSSVNRHSDFQLLRPVR